jgi:acyl-CoA dehydrogenase
MAQETLAARMAAQRVFVGRPCDVHEGRASVAKLRCGLAAERVCAIAHAVLGAIGVSEECTLPWYTGRLRARRLGEWALSQEHDFTGLARAL